MADLKDMSRVLYHHEWTNVDDWARSVAELAELNDDEVQQLTDCSGEVAAPLPRRTTPAAASRSSPAARSHPRPFGFLGGMRLGLRRAF